MNISVLGCGRWGSFLAWYSDRIGHSVTLWGRESSSSLQELCRTRKNEYVTLPESIVLTGDLQQAVTTADVLILSISAQGLRDFLPKLLSSGYREQPVLLCMKGLEAATGKRLTEIAKECGVRADRLAVWVGPGHIQCFTAGIPNCMVIDAENRRLTASLVEQFQSDLIKFYYGNDLIGSEIGAAAKNVIGIAAGMLDGAGYSTLKGALMARGSREVARLIRALGGEELTAYGLCHLGDYETTLFSPYSNNRRFGELFIRKEPFEKLAEGVKTAEGMLKLAAAHHVDLPITRAVSSIINDGEEPTGVLLRLFSRNNKVEFY